MAQSGNDTVSSRNLQTGCRQVFVSVTTSLGPLGGSTTYPGYSRALLGICYRPNTSPTFVPPDTADYDANDVKLAAGSVTPFTTTKILSDLPAGGYFIGLCAYAAASWGTWDQNVDAIRISMLVF